MSMFFLRGALKHAARNGYLRLVPLAPQCLAASNPRKSFLEHSDLIDRWIPAA